MNRTQMARIQAALDAMIEGKLLFQQEKRLGQIIDGYIFRVPGSHDYCVLMLFSSLSGQRIEKIECDFPLAAMLLQELAAGGKYQQYQEISINSPDAQRVLAMFREWVMINTLRHGKNLLPEPDPERADAGEGDISVHYS